MEKIKAILIDDELNSLQNLQQKLEGFLPGYKHHCHFSKAGRRFIAYKTTPA